MTGDENQKALDKSIELINNPLKPDPEQVKEAERRGNAWWVKKAKQGK